MEKGHRGELYALGYLLSLGCIPVAENFRSGHHEIDLIMLDGEVLVFIEVKLRSSSSFGLPEDFVDDNKMEFIRLAAEDWMVRHSWGGRIRFDIVAILEVDGMMEITHFCDAF